MERDEKLKFDHMGRPIMVEMERKKINIEYDGAGNINKVTDSQLGIHLFFYDILNRLIMVRSPDGDDTTYSYDAVGNRIKMTYSDEEVVNYFYNPNNALIEIKKGKNRVLYEYDDSGRLLRKILPNNTHVNYEFDNKNNTIKIIVKKNDKIILDYYCAMDTKGNCIKIQRKSKKSETKINFKYDSENQLIKASYSDGKEFEYQYDDKGNRILEKIYYPHKVPLMKFIEKPAKAAGVLGSKKHFQYNPDNQLKSSEDVECGYDNLGNLQISRDESKISQYHFKDNKLVKIDFSDGTSSEYEYDAFGRRVTKINRQEEVRNYLYDGHNLISEFDDDGDEIASYVYDIYIDHPIYMIRDEGTYYFLYDHLGSVIALLDDEGEIVAEYDYDAWGNIVKEEGDIENPFRFTGREWDEESGLYFYRERYYDPKIGRFISSDPILGHGGEYDYLYVKNNPQTYVDPLGLFPMYPFGAKKSPGISSGYTDPNTISKGFTPHPWSSLDSQPLTLRNLDLLMSTGNLSPLDNLMMPHHTWPANLPKQPGNMPKWLENIQHGYGDLIRWFSIRHFASGVYLSGQSGVGGFGMSTDISYDLDLVYPKNTGFHSSISWMKGGFGLGVDGGLRMAFGKGPMTSKNPYFSFSRQDINFTWTPDWIYLQINLLPLIPYIGKFLKLMNLPFSIHWGTSETWKLGSETDDGYDYFSNDENEEEDDLIKEAKRLANKRERKKKKKKKKDDDYYGDGGGGPPPNGGGGPPKKKKKSDRDPEVKIGEKFDDEDDNYWDDAMNEKDDDGGNGGGGGGWRESRPKMTKEKQGRSPSPQNQPTPQPGTASEPQNQPVPQPGTTPTPPNQPIPIPPPVTTPDPQNQPTPQPQTPPTPQNQPTPQPQTPPTPQNQPTPQPQTPPTPQYPPTPGTSPTPQYPPTPTPPPVNTPTHTPPPVPTPTPYTPPTPTYPPVPGMPPWADTTWAMQMMMTSGLGGVGGVLFDKAAEICTDTEEITGVYWDDDLKQLVILGKKNEKTEEFYLPQMDKDHLAVALRSVYSGDNLGVSIDPSPEYLESGQTPPDGTDMLVRYLGGTEESLFGTIMFEADKLLKNLSMGKDNVTKKKVESQVDGFKNELELAMQYGTGRAHSWSRMWFVIENMRLNLEVKESSDRNTLVFGKSSLKVKAEYMSGQENPGVDPNSARFAEHFTIHYDEFAWEYPILEKLKEIAKIAAIAKWLKNTGKDIDLSFLDDNEFIKIPNPKTTPGITVSEITSFANGPRIETRIFELHGGVDFDFEFQSTEENYDTLITRRMAEESKPYEFTGAWDFQLKNQLHRATAYPIGAVTDKFITKHRDISISTRRGNDFELTRLFDSSKTRTAAFGVGWDLHIPYKIFIINSKKSDSPLVLIDKNTGQSERYVYIKDENAYYRLIDEKVEGRGVSFSYDPSSSIRKDTEGNFHWIDQGSAYHFNKNGLLNTLSSKDTGDIHYIYQGDMVVEIENSSGESFELTYDELKRVKEVLISPGKRKINYAYNSVGNLIKVSEDGDDSKTITYSYDANHRLIKAHENGKTILRRNYDESGRLVKDGIVNEVGEAGNLISKIYEDYKLLREEDNFGNRIEYAYDGDTNLKSAKILDKYNNNIDIQYNPEERIKSVINPEGNSLEFNYDNDGNITSIIDENGNSRKFAFDKKGNLVLVRDALGNEWKFDFDYESHHINMTDPLGEKFVL